MRKLVLVVVVLLSGCGQQPKSTPPTPAVVVSQDEQQPQEQSAQQQEQTQEENTLEQSKKLVEEEKRLAAFAYFDFTQSEQERLLSKGLIQPESKPRTVKFDTSPGMKVALKVGSTGPVTMLRIVQVINDTTFLAQLGISKQTVLAIGWDVSGAVEGEGFMGEDGKDLTVRVIGIKEYKTVLGANKRVYVIEPFDLYSYEADWLSQNQIEQPRKWSSTNGKFSIVATLVKQESDSITLLKSNGQEIKVQTEKLSKSDLKYLESKK